MLPRLDPGWVTWLRRGVRLYALLAVHLYCVTCTPRLYTFILYL